MELDISLIDWEKLQAELVKSVECLRELESLTVKYGAMRQLERNDLVDLHL